MPVKHLFEKTKHSFSNGGNFILEMGPYDDDEDTPKKPLLIELTKLTFSTKDLKLPFTIGSFIPKLRQHFFVKEMKETINQDILNTTTTTNSEIKIEI